MKIKEAMLLWNSNSPDVIFVKHPDKFGVGRNYRKSSGACWMHWKDLSLEKQLFEILKDWIYLVEVDKVDSIAVKNAMLTIDEIRQVFPDI
jgi:hypothetical protein